jgi:hypothetical protein
MERFVTGNISAPSLAEHWSELYLEAKEQMKQLVAEIK